MANIKISQLAALTPPAAADVLPIVDISANATKKTTVGEVVGIISGDVDVSNDGTATISELPVSKLQDGAARQLLQTDAAGTGVEWTSNVHAPGVIENFTGNPGAGTPGTRIVSGDGGILITNDVNPFLRCYTLNGGFPDALQIAANGNVTNANNSYGAISDLKLKENIVDATSQWDDIKSLQVRKYNLKKGQTHTQIGLVAQEAELVSPGLVTESTDRDEDGNDLGTVTKSVNYSVLYMKAVKALQEAMDRIEILEAKVDALKAS